uniref:NF-X1-type domain-containing protein n=1 Tax=Lygus hesperus TaxID=30085 RepID=A0A0K8TC13_LYGHE
MPLACEHKCIHRCHPTDRSHEGVFKCSNICKKRMDCSHSCILTCHIYNKMINCFCQSCTPKTICDFKFSCGHTCKSMGHSEDVEHKDEFRCNQICNTVLGCGHTCCSLCHVEDIDHKKRYRCPIICEGKLFCGHQCQKKLYNKKHVCSDHKTTCGSTCAAVMPCGHICRRRCHIQDRSHETVYKCLQCGNTKSTKASTAIVDVSHPMLKNDYKKNQQLTKCIHGETMHSCDKVCGYNLGCGHQCNEKCHLNEDIHTTLCVEKCGAILPCGHSCQEACHMLKSCSDLCQTCAEDQTIECSHGLVSTCKEKCNFEYKCGHLCTKMCRHSSDVTHSEPCKQQCDQLLQCLHRCKKSCHFEDSSQHGTPCEQQCAFLCLCGHICKKLCHYEHPVVHNSKSHLLSPCEACVELDLPDQETPTSTADAHLNLKKEATSHCIDQSPDQKTSKHKASKSKNKKCDFKFKCGHSCEKKRRHSTNVTHSKPCKQKCSQPLSCGHFCKLSCHFDDPSKHGVPSRCRACMKNEGLSELILETSNANVPETCNIGDSSGQCIHGVSLISYCEKTCDFKYPCGHSCQKKCRHVTDATHSKTCRRVCDRPLACGHLCKLLCHREASTQHTAGGCATCIKTTCQVYLHCGHRCCRSRHSKDNIHECSSCKITV